MQTLSGTIGEQMAKTFRAVYKDAQGHTYSCPVEIHNGGWMLITTSGFAPIIHSLDNEEYGVVTFDSYSEQPDTRLHLPDRIGTESSFQQLQRANAARINEERKNRELARAEAQSFQPNPAKVALAREINGQYAAQKNRHGINN